MSDNQSEKKNVHSNQIVNSDNLLKSELAAEPSNALAQCNLGVRYFRGDGLAQNFEEAFRWFKKAAEQGDERAQYNLGTCYLKGDGVAQNCKEAFKWFKKAAEKGYRDAQCNLGICYFAGDGIAQSYGEAFRWFKKAAEQGDERAQYNLGTCYLKGEGVAQNFKEAFKWSQMAAEKGHTDAQCNLGFCYFNGQGIEKNYNLAVKCYTEAAEKENIHAQYSLGICYYFAENLEEQNYQSAFKWFKRAADKGDPNAQFRLGICFYFGHGVKKDHCQSLEWFKKAAEQGNESVKHASMIFCSKIGTTDEENESFNATVFMSDNQSEKKNVHSNQIVNSDNLRKSELAAEPINAAEQCNLGVRYLSGDGVAQNFEEAFRWFEKAANQGDGLSQSNLGTCYFLGCGVKKNNKEAFRWFRKAADQGDVMAHYNVGTCYLSGDGVTQNYKKAFKWLKKAADQGDERAQYNVGFCYSNGYGVTKDSKEAFRWYQKAAKQGNELAKNALNILRSNIRTTDEEKEVGLNNQGLTNTQSLIESNKKVEYSEEIKLLKEKKADVNKSDIAGVIPLSMAASYGHVEVINTLLNTSPPVNPYKTENFLRSIEQRLAKISENPITIKDIKNIKVDDVEKTERMRSLLVKRNKQLDSIKVDLKKNNLYVDYARYEKMQIALNRAENYFQILQNNFYRQEVERVDSLKKLYDFSIAKDINSNEIKNKPSNISSADVEIKPLKDPEVDSQSELKGLMEVNSTNAQKNKVLKVAVNNEFSMVSQNSKKNKNQRGLTTKEKRVQKAQNDKMKREEAKSLKAAEKGKKEEEIKQRQAAAEQTKTDSQKITPTQRLGGVELSSDNENNSVHQLDAELNSSVVVPLIKRSSLTFFSSSTQSPPASYKEPHSPEEKKENIAQPLSTDPIPNLPSKLNSATGTENDKGSQSPKEKTNNIAEPLSTDPMPNLPSKLNSATGTEDDKGSQSPKEKTNNIAEPLSTYPIPDLPSKLNSTTSTDDYKASQFPTKGKTKDPKDIAEPLPAYPVGNLPFKLKSTDLNLTQEQKLGLDQLAKLKKALQPLGIELRLGGSFVLGLATLTVLGARCFIPNDIDVHIDLSKKHELLLSVQKALIECGFVVKPESLSNGYLNFISADPAIKVDISIKLTNLPENFNPFLLTSVTMDFEKFKEDFFYFTLNPTDAILLNQWLIRGEFPVLLPDSRDPNVRRFPDRLLKYTDENKNKLIPVYILPHGRINNLDYYWKTYFDNLLKSGNKSHLNHHYQSMRKISECNLFPHPDAENIVYHLCLAHLNAKFGENPNNQKPALNMTRFLQKYFINRPTEAEQFSSYLKKLIQLGPHNLKNTLLISSIMLKHMIDRDNFLKSPRYISFCCSCSLAEKYPHASSRDLQLASANMSTVLINCFKYLSKQNLFNCMKELIEKEVAFLAEADNIKILTDEICRKLFIDPKDSSEPMSFSHPVVPFNYSPTVNFSSPQERKKKQLPDGGTQSEAPISNTFNPI